MKMQKKAQYSGYWLGDRYTGLNLAKRGDSTSEAIQLASIKKAIGNFVRILTGKSIPVFFSSGQQSFTPGDQIVISASTDEKEFDAVVGLACHEASHIAKSNFKFLKFFKNHDRRLLAHNNLLKRAMQLDITPLELSEYISMLMNIFEDRWIDYYQYNNAPGYRPYYDSMYDAYYHSVQIDLALQSGEFNTPNLRSYEFQLINMTNPWFDTNALPDLDLIYGIIDLDTIYRLDATKDDGYKYCQRSIVTFEHDKLPKLFQLACEVMDIILKNIEKQTAEDKKSKSDEGSTEEDSSLEDNLDNMGGSEDDSDSDDDSKRKSKTPSQTPSKNGKINASKLADAIKKQKDFIKGEVQKQEINNTTITRMNAIENSSASIEDVSFETTNNRIDKTKVLVLRKMTESIMASGAFPFTMGGDYISENQNTHRHLTPCAESQNAVSNGTRAGMILAQRLSIRNQNQLTKFNRRNSGYLDKRRLSVLGVEDESVFYRLRNVKYAPVDVHLSIDASTSMKGERWEKSLTVAVALATASSKIENLDVVISVRSGTANYATIAIIYDSKQDDVSKIKKLFPYLRWVGTTPEGLTFEAIMDILLASKSPDRYFINLSDGEPYYNNYSGLAAQRHTKAQVQRLTNEGIKVLSYFITDKFERSYNSSSTSTRKVAFESMYGKNASFINVEKLPSLVSTLNKLFLIR